MDTSLLPIGTSRLHWPLEYIKRNAAASVLFPGFGYFQSAGQIRSVVEILTGERAVPDICHYVFRRDATMSNPFDERALTSDPAFWAQCKHLFETADVMLLEFASPIEFILDDLHVQGNPNYLRDIPYSNVWQRGYYADYEPDVPVKRRTFDDKQLMAVFTDIAELIGDRPVICLSHIYHRESDYGRARFAGSVAAAVARLGWTFIDSAMLVEKFGFRQLSNGKTDIHHLSWTGVRELAIQIMQAVELLTGKTVSKQRLDLIIHDQHEFLR